LLRSKGQLNPDDVGHQNHEDRELSDTGVLDPVSNPFRDLALTEVRSAGLIERVAGVPPDPDEQNRRNEIIHDIRRPEIDVRAEAGEGADHSRYQEREQNERDRTNRCVPERDVGRDSHREHTGEDERYERDHHVGDVASDSIRHHMIEIVVIDEAPGDVGQRHHDQRHDDLARKQLLRQTLPRLGNVDVVLSHVRLLHGNLLHGFGIHTGH